MAYKKTGGRSVTVQPTGMPDLSGFFESARQLEQVGNLASSIGTDIRKREYNDLLRQAEIDGETAGAVYKKDKNGQWFCSHLLILITAKQLRHMLRVTKRILLMPTESQQQEHMFLLLLMTLA